MVQLLLTVIYKTSNLLSFPLTLKRCGGKMISNSTTERCNKDASSSGLEVLYRVKKRMNQHCELQENFTVGYWVFRSKVLRPLWHMDHVWLISVACPSVLICSWTQINTWLLPVKVTSHPMSEPPLCTVAVFSERLLRCVWFLKPQWELLSTNPKTDPRDKGEQTQCTSALTPEKNQSRTKRWGGR